MQKRDALRIGDYDVEPSLNQVIRGPQVLPVEPRVMDLLVLLAESPGRVFGRDEILERVWPDTTVQDDALRRVVALLRRTLDDDPKAPRYIETITRRGYRLVAPVSHPEPEPGPPPVNRTPRRPWGALALAVLAVAAIWLFPRGGDPEVELSLRPLTSLPGNESEPTFSADGERVAFIHGDGESRRLMVKGVGASEARRLLEAPGLAGPAWSPDGRRVLAVVRADDCRIVAVDVDDPSRVETLYTCSDGERLDQVVQPDDGTVIFSRRPGRFGSPWRIHRLDLATGESFQLTLPDEPGNGDIFMALSPDRRRVAVIRGLIVERSRLFILDWSTGDQEVVEHFPDTSWHVAWSADARSLLFADETGLFELDLDGGIPERLIPSPRDLRQPSVSPAGRRVAVVEQRLRSNIVRLPHPELGADVEPEIVASSTREDYRPRFAPDGERLAFISGRSGRSEIWVAGPGGGAERLFGLDHPNHIHAFLWSPEGDRIAVSDHDSRILIVDVATGDTEVVPGSPSAGHLMDWSADGSSVYRLEVTGGSPEVWRIRLDDGDRRQVTRCGARTAQESPDGEALYLTRLHTPGLWRVELDGDGQPTKLLDDFRGFAWTSSDRGIYSYEARETAAGIYFRESAVGEPVLVVPLPLAKISFSVSRDHRWFAYARASLEDGDILLIEG